MHCRCISRPFSHCWTSFRWFSSCSWKTWASLSSSNHGLRRDSYASYYSAAGAYGKNRKIQIIDYFFLFHKSANFQCLCPSSVYIFASTKVCTASRMFPDFIFESLGLTTSPPHFTMVCIQRNEKGIHYAKKRPISEASETPRKKNVLVLHGNLQHEINPHSRVGKLPVVTPMPSSPDRVVTLYEKLPFKKKIRLQHEVLL